MIFPVLKMKKTQLLFEIFSIYLYLCIGINK